MHIEVYPSDNYNEPLLCKRIHAQSTLYIKVWMHWLMHVQYMYIIILLCVILFTIQACKSMCMWVRAMDLYSRVFRTVEPKREKYVH